MAEGPIPDDAEARRLAGLLLAGEARVGRLRDRLKAHLQDREPLALDGIELGFFPTKGRYDAAAVFRAATGRRRGSLASPRRRWPTLAAFLKRRPEVAQSFLRVEPFAAVVRPPEDEDCQERGRRPDRVDATDNVAAETEP